jgi:hypothetical protein
MGIWQGVDNGLLKVSSGLAMSYPSMPCGWATPETALRPFQEWRACRAGNLRPSSTLSDTPFLKRRLRYAYDIQNSLRKRWRQLFPSSIPEMNSTDSTDKKPYIGQWTGHDIVIDLAGLCKWNIDSRIFSPDLWPKIMWQLTARRHLTSDHVTSDFWLLTSDFPELIFPNWIGKIDSCRSGKKSFARRRRVCEAKIRAPNSTTTKVISLIRRTLNGYIVI